MNKKALIAEFIGPFALCYGGILSIHNSGGNLVVPALCHGLIIAVFVTAFAAISGGHLNPAVTCAFIATGKIKMTDGIAYIVSQCIGAVCGSLAVLGSGLGKDVVSGGTPVLAPNLTMVNGIVLEAIATFFFLLVIFGTAVDKRAPKMGGLLIGLTISLDILAIGPLTGGAMNPSRWLGPALVTQENLGNVVIYFVGPILGAVLGAVLYDKVLAPQSTE
ncbi:MAG: aquaporin [Armatimonadetes bacterium]|nr:aquaporin [Armatimonadota bacterium]MBS1728846.1 aquaporin [Armatimonadota bacterium]